MKTKDALKNGVVLFTATLAGVAAYKAAGNVVEREFPHLVSKISIVRAAAGAISDVDDDEEYDDED